MEILNRAKAVDLCTGTKGAHCDTGKVPHRQASNVMQECRQKKERKAHRMYGNDLFMSTHLVNVNKECVANAPCGCTAIPRGGRVGHNVLRSCGEEFERISPSVSQGIKAKHDGKLPSFVRRKSGTIL